uniref:Uncharacterized protein n=1 Tax=Arundo donax TaxID=35708 RepID=A0A0A8ZIY8_ARUDO
MSPIALLYII